MRKMLWKRIKERKAALIVFVVFWIVAAVIAQPFSHSGTDVEKKTALEAEETVGEIYGDTTIRQTFQAEGDDLMGISLKFATFERSNAAEYRLTLTDENGQVILKERIYAYLLNDNEFYRMDFAPQGNSLGKQFTIEIKALEAQEGNAITLWKSQTDVQAASKLTIGQKEAQGELLMNSYYSDARVYTWKVLLWSLLIVLSFVACLLVNGVTARDFLLVSLLLGVLFVFVVPFTHRIDEIAHAEKSMSIAMGNLFTQHTVGPDGTVGVILPKNAENFAVFSGSMKNIVLDPAWWEPMDEPEAFFAMPAAASYLPLSYYPSAIGVWLGRILGLPLICVIWLGRLANFAVYAALGYRILRTTACYRSLFFILLTAPMALFLAGSYSIDGLLIACSLLFIAICLKYIFDPLQMRIALSDKLGLILCSIIIFSTKYAGYAPIVLLFLFVPRRLMTKGEFWAMCGALALSLAATVGWQLILLNQFTYDLDKSYRNANVLGQMKNIYRDMGGFLRTLFTHLSDNGISYISMMGNSYISNTIDCLNGAVTLFPLAAAALAKDGCVLSDKKKQKRLELYYILSSAAMAIIVIVSLYLSWTAVGADEILGVQERYFHPFYIFPLMIIARLPIQNKIQNWDRKIGLFMILGIIGLLLSYMAATFPVANISYF